MDDQSDQDHQYGFSSDMSFMNFDIGRTSLEVNQAA